MNVISNEARSYSVKYCIDYGFCSSYLLSSDGEIPSSANYPGVNVGFYIHRLLTPALTAVITPPTIAGTIKEAAVPAFKIFNAAKPDPALTAPENKFLPPW